MARSATSPVPAPSPPPGGAPIRVVLAALAVEVSELAVAADGLQSLVGGLLSDPLASVTVKQLEQGQMLDAVVQRLQALETFLGALAPTVDASWIVDSRSAADLLLLSRVAQKLSGIAVEAEAEPLGDCDFF